MTKRIVVYATIYGVIGVTIGVLMALYTKEDQAAKNIILDRFVNNPTPVNANPENEEVSEHE